MASRRLGGSTVGTDILSYDEKSQAQSFLKEFFAVFGVDIVLFNTFEHRVKFGDGSQGYADKANIVK